MSLASPLVLRDRFAVESELGRGASGTVFAAWDRRHGQRVAIKRLDRLTASALLRFKREFRALAGLRHPGLVQLRELLVDDANALLVMELVNGVPIAEACRDEGELRASFRRLAEALAALHAFGKLHRDVKPANVLVTPERRVVLLDFGLVSSDDADVSTDVLGTPAYTSPEQARGGPLGPASDWYAFGVLLFEQLCARRPFEGRAVEVLLQKTSTDPPRVGSLARHAPVELARLTDALLARDPSARPEAAEILGVLAGEAPVIARDPPFLGRAREIAALRELVDGDDLAIGVVEGAPGLGKSALLEALMRSLDGGPALVLQGRCYARETIRHAAFDGVMDRIATWLARDEHARIDPEVIREASAMFPVLASSLARARHDEQGDPFERRRRAVVAVRRLLHAISERARAVIVLDDVHWADDDSARLFSGLFAGPDPPRVVVIAAFREDARSALCALLRRFEAPSARVARIALAPLDARTSEELVVALASSEVDPTTLVDQGRGHPLLLCELARGSRVARAGSSTLKELLLARVDRVGPLAKDLLETMAVAGRPLHESELRLLAAPGSVYDATDELRDARLVRDEPTSDLGWTLRPTHDQLADSVRSTLLPSRIAELAGRLGRGLEGSEFAQAEEIGRHHRMAGEMERAREWLARAASQAMDALAWVRALALLEEVLTLTDEPLARSSTLEQMAKAYGGAGRNLDAADAYLRAAAGATGERAAELRFLAADRRLRGGDLEAGLRAMDIALSDVGARLQHSAPEALASLLYHRARISWRGLEFTPRAEHELDPVTARRVDRLWSAGMGLTSLDSVRGTDFMARALLEALELGDARRIARSLATEAAAVSNRGASTRAEARALLTRAREIGAPIDDPTLRALLFSVECLVDFHAGRLESARRIARRAEDELSTAFAMSREISIACFVELQMLGMMGRFRELAERMDRLLPDVDDRQERYGMAMLRNGFPSHRWLADDDPARALEENRRAASFWPDGPLRVPDFASYFGSVDACLYADDVAAARELVEQFRPKLARTLLRRIEFVDVIALDVQGRVALAMPSERLPTNEVRRTIRHLHAIATPVAKARAEMLAGGLARHAQRREDARAAYLRAEDAAREAELLAVASVARREADRMANLDVSASDDALRQLGVRNPMRLAAMLAPPGFL